ncbi:MAG: hypothetical protein AAGB46_16075, partial [Verrucomicrobiota bacterium]
AYETYHFMEGKRFGGSVKDGSLDDMDFQGVVSPLAGFMKARNYFQASSQTEGDLLIIVHYGVTSTEVDMEEFFLIGDFADDAYGDVTLSENEDGQTEVNQVYDLGMEDIKDMNRRADAIGTGAVAKLLGFQKALNKRNLLESEEFDLRAELEDERYFIILMAYDWQKILKGNEKQLMWTTRFSLNSIGTNFDAARFTLSRAAMGYFGTDLENLTKENTFHGEGKIEHGELEIVGEETE